MPKERKDPPNPFRWVNDAIDGDACQGTQYRGLGTDTDQRMVGPLGNELGNRLLEYQRFDLEKLEAQKEQNHSGHEKLIAR